MNKPSSIDEQSFRRLLSRNVGLPLGVGVLSAAVFIGIIVYLLSVIDWVEHTDRVINNANEATKLSIDMETGMRGYLLSGAEGYLDPYELAKPRLAAELPALQALVSDNPRQVDRLTRIMALQKDWLDYGEQLIALKRSTGDYSSVVQTGRGKRLTDAIRKEYEGFIAVEQQLRVERSENVSRTIWTSVSLYVLFVFVVSALLAYFGRRDMTELSTSYGGNLAALQKGAKRLQDQAWLRTGQTQLAEQLLGQQTLQMLGRNMLQFFAQYLGTVVAAVYIREEHGNLRRIASYGFSREREVMDQVLLNGEGIAGQAVQRNRVIRLDDVPADYLRLSSGLGEGAARSVLVIPTSDNDHINAVVELGFLRPLTDRDLEIVELLADNIGTAIEAARYRQRLQEVLAETQQLNEELQVQQEELKTANEELEEQSRVLKESQAYQETQQA